MNQEDTQTFVLLGKMGSGKSRTGNTILGFRNAFEFSGLASAQTNKCKLQCRKRFGSTINVVDTPGKALFQKSDYEEMKRFLMDAGLENLTYLFCVPAGRFTIEETEILMQYCTYFGKCFVDRTIIVFTRLDVWEEDMIDSSDTLNPNFDQFISSLPPLTQETLEKFGNRYLALNNRKGTEENEFFTKYLIQLSKSLPNGKDATTEDEQGTQIIQSLYLYVSRLTGFVSRCWDFFIQAITED